MKGYQVGRLPPGLELSLVFFNLYQCLFLELLLPRPLLRWKETRSSKDNRSSA